jgi:hypothetical protein
MKEKMQKALIFANNINMMDKIVGELNFQGLFFKIVIDMNIELQISEKFNK